MRMTLVAECAALNIDAAEQLAGLVCGPEAVCGATASGLDGFGESVVRSGAWKGKDNGVSLNYTHTDVFDACRIECRAGEDILEKLKLWVADAQRMNKQWIQSRMLLFRSDADDIQPRSLFAGTDRPNTLSCLADLARGELALVGTKSLLDRLPEVGSAPIYENDVAFAVRINSWSEDLSTFVYGAISYPPAIVAGVFPDHQALREACDGIAANVVHPSTMLDMSVTNLLSPLHRLCRWVVALNQGDTGSEDAIFGVYGRISETELRALREVCAIGAEVDISGGVLAMTSQAWRQTT